MPKFSVSVPEELWDRAKQLDLGFDEESPSTIFQRYIGEAIRESERQQALVQSPDLDAVVSKEELDEIKSAKRNEMRQLYAKAVREGIELARSMSWADLDSLATYDFDILRWNSDRPEIDQVQVGYLDDPTIDHRRPGRTRLAGREQGLRKVWDYVVASSADEDRSDGRIIQEGG